MDDQSGESKEEELMGEGIGESEIEELGPDWGWRRVEGSLFQCTLSLKVLVFSWITWANYPSLDVAPTITAQRTRQTAKSASRSNMRP